MKQNILDTIIPELETTPGFFVPIKKLWVELKEKLQADEIPGLEEFIQLIKEDKRFVVLEVPPPPWADDPEQTERMETLGFYSGFRVRLKTRVPSQDDMTRIVTQHAQKVLDSLMKAYQARPEDISDENEAKLIQAMNKAKQLKEMIEETLSKTPKKK